MSFISTLGAVVSILISFVVESVTIFTPSLMVATTSKVPSFSSFISGICSVQTFTFTLRFPSPLVYVTPSTTTLSVSPLPNVTEPVIVGVVSLLFKVFTVGFVGA